MKNRFSKAVYVPDNVLSALYKRECDKGYL
jgi:hypothetical protein